MKNDYVQASLRHSRFLFVYSAKHATGLERMRKRGCALRSGVIHAKHATVPFYRLRHVSDRLRNINIYGTYMCYYTKSDINT